MSLDLMLLAFLAVGHISPRDWVNGYPCSCVVKGAWTTQRQPL